MPPYRSLWDRVGLSAQRFGGAATQLVLRDPMQHLENPGLVAKLAVQPAMDLTGLLAAATSPFSGALMAAQGVASAVNDLTRKGFAARRDVFPSSSSARAIDSGVAMVPFKRANASIPLKRTTVRSVGTSLPRATVRSRRVGSRSIPRRSRMRFFGFRKKKRWSKFAKKYHRRFVRGRK